MHSYRQLAPGAYLVAAVMFFFPLYDSSVSLLPWAPGRAQWRFGAFGLLSNTLMIVALAALIAVAAAILANQDRTRRVLGVVSWVLAGFLLLAFAGFALDAVQARAQIRPDMLPSYKIASITAEVKLVLGAVSFALFGRACRSEFQVRQESPANTVLVGKRA